MTTNRIDVCPATQLSVHRWRNQTAPPDICIRKGAHFITVTTDEAYALVNAVHDMAEHLELAQKRQENP